MASVFFAVILSSLMMSLKEGSYAGMINSMVGAYAGYAQVHSDGYWADRTIDNLFESSASLINVIKKHDDISGYVPRLESFALAISDSVSKGAMVVGIHPEKEKAFAALHERVENGAYLEGSDKFVMIGNGLADYLQLGVGDTLVMLGQGYHGISAAGKYPIKGIVKFGSPELSKQLVFLPLQEMQRLYGAQEMYSTFILLISKPGRASAVVSDLRKQIPAGFEVMDWTEMMPELVNMIETDRVEGYVFMFILYLVIGFGIFGTTLMMLVERKREFGILVAIGMKRIKLAAMVWLEIIFISVIGAVLGVLAAFPVSYYFHINPIEFGEEIAGMMEDYGMEAVLQSSVEPSIFIQQGVVIAILASFISIYPFLSLLRMNAIKAMRS